MKVKNQTLARIHGSDCHHIIFCQSKVPDIEIFYHALFMYGFWNGNHSALLKPPQYDLCCCFSVFPSDS